MVVEAANLRPFEEDSELTSPKEIRINHTNIMLDSVTRSNMIHQYKIEDCHPQAHSSMTSDIRWKLAEFR